MLLKSINSILSFNCTEIKVLSVKYLKNVLLCVHSDKCLNMRMFLLYSKNGDKDVGLKDFDWQKPIVSNYTTTNVFIQIIKSF